MKDLNKLTSAIKLWSAARKNNVHKRVVRRGGDANE